MGMISETQARAVLLPYEQDLLGCVEAAWNKWKQGGSGLVAMPRSRFRSGVISGLIDDQVRARFGAKAGVHLIDKGERLLVGVQSRLLVRFKKVDAEYKTSNYPTRTARKFDAQEPLDLYEDLPRVTVGYRLNRLATELLDVVVIFAKNERILWCYPLLGAGQVQQLSLSTHFAPGVQTAPKKRVTGKAAPSVEKKAGSEGEDT